mgnify:CR=1 FL=1
MPEALLTILKFFLVALIYLFFFRVLRAVWAEVTTTARAATSPAAPAARPARPAGGGARPHEPLYSDNNCSPDSGSLSVIFLVIICRYAGWRVKMSFTDLAA